MELHTIEVALSNVLDLCSGDELQTLGLSNEQLLGTDYEACQEVGGAVAWLEHDGLLVPSARGAGMNLVVYPASQGSDTEFDVVESTELPAEPNE